MAKKQASYETTGLPLSIFGLIIKTLVVWMMFTLIEPLFELVCLALHNLVFGMIAHLSFSGVSLGSMVGFLIGLPSATALDQYFIMMPWALIIGLFVAIRSSRTRVSLVYTLVQALILFLLAIAIIIFVTSALINWQSFPVIFSLFMSSIYWFFSISLTWVSLRILRIL